jgi:hypothetical protein
VINKEDKCLDAGCEWYKDDNVDDNNDRSDNDDDDGDNDEEKNGNNICIFEGIRNISCEFLLKKHCKEFLNTNISSFGIPDINITVSNNPCVFIGNDENDLSCISKSSSRVNRCGNIKNNDVFIYEGKRFELCNDAHFFFGWDKMCGWIDKETFENEGSCGSVYYFSKNGLISIFSFIFNYFFFFFFFFVILFC